VDTSGEDHAADEIRYACMSRPWVPPVKEAPERTGPRWRDVDEEDDDEGVSWKVV
jgi:hypothetical protein